MYALLALNPLFIREMVPGAGLEPARPYERGILNPLCLPISPPGQRGILVLLQAGIAKHIWRRNPESNRDTRICNPLHSHSAIPPFRYIRVVK